MKEINGRNRVIVDTTNTTNLRSRYNVDGIGLASGLRTVRVFGYSVASNFFKSSRVTDNLTII